MFAFVGGAALAQQQTAPPPGAVEAAPTPPIWTPQEQIIEGSAATGAGSGVSDRTIGDNPSRGTDAQGTVDPPSGDRDANDALKKAE